jgi:hypothetical protein
MNTIPTIFYRDKKSNYFDCTVSARDENGELVRKDLPLEAYLLYDNGEKVANQSILKCGKTDQLRISHMNNFMCRLKLRIDASSYRHKRRKFMVKVCVDTKTDPSASDISPATTPPILVMSKAKTLSTLGKRKGPVGRGDGDINTTEDEHKETRGEIMLSYLTQNGNRMVLCADVESVGGLSLSGDHYTAASYDDDSSDLDLSFLDNMESKLSDGLWENLSWLADDAEDAAAAAAAVQPEMSK